MPKEWKIGAYIFFIFSPVELGYICYKVYDAVHFKDNPTHKEADGVLDSTIACGVGAVLVRLTVIVTGILVFRNFGNGLKEKLQTPSSKS